MDPSGGVPWSDLVADRLPFLERLAAEPAGKAQLEADLECSRSTIDRAVRRLESAGLVERTAEGYVTTTTGRLAAERFRAYVADQRTIEDARPVVEALPPGCAVPYELLAGGSAETVDGEPHRAFERVAGQLRSADRYRVAIPELGDSRHLRLLHARVVHDGLEAELLVGEDCYDRVAGEFPRLVADLVAAESCSVRRADVRPFGLALAETRESASVVLSTYEGKTYAGTVENEADAAVECAREVLASTRESGDAVEEPPAGGDAGTPLAPDAMRAERTLADAGTTRLDRGYFTERTPGDPETAWRVGFDLVDAYYGYPVDRVDPSPGGPNAGDPAASTTVESGSGPVASAWLVDELAGGTDHLVVGPAGSGKSTLCRQVASRWVEAGHGPVFYRESPASGEADLSGLAAVVGAAEGHALVVVEDAAGPVAESFLRLLAAVRDDPTVTVLGEARERAWQGAVDGVAEPRLRELARADLATYRLPGVDERTCRRAIDAFEAATGREVPLSPAGLLDRVENEGGIGEMYVLSYLVVAHTDPTPWLEDSVGPSVLDGDVRATYGELAPGTDGRPGDADDTLPLEVGLLVATLAAAERTVTPGLVHAVAAARGANGEGDDRRTDRLHRRVEAVLDDLDGRLLVRREDATAFRTQHPRWATRFLEHALDRAERETVALFERAVDAVLALADDPDRRERIESWLGRAAPEVRRVGDPDGADEFVEALFGLGLTRSTLAPLLGTTEHSGIELPAACSPGTRLEVVSCRGKMWYDHGDPERAETELSTLCDRAETADADPDVRATYLAEAYRGLGEVVVDRGETAAARGYLERSLEAAREGAHPRHEVGALNSLAWVAMTVDDYDRAEQHLAAAQSIAADLGPCGDHSTTLYYRARLEQLRGNLAAAEERLAETVEMDREVGTERDLSSSLKLLADVAKDRGAYDRAAEHYRRSIERKREVGDRQGTAQALYDFGDLQLRRGDLPAAESAFERSRELARENDLSRAEGRVLVGLGRLALERGNPERAAERFREGRAIHADLDHRRGVASATRGLGDVARERGDLAAARERYRESYETYRDIGNPRDAVDVIEDLVETCAAAGDEATALAHCETGIDICEEADLDCEALLDRRDALAAG